MADGDAAQHLDAVVQQGRAKGHGGVFGRVGDGDLFLDRGLTGLYVAIDLEIERAGRTIKGLQAIAAIALSEKAGGPREARYLRIDAVIGQVRRERDGGGTPPGGAGRERDV